MKISSITYHLKLVCLFNDLWILIYTMLFKHWSEFLCIFCLAHIDSYRTLYSVILKCTKIKVLQYSYIFIIFALRINFIGGNVPTCTICLLLGFFCKMASIYRLLFGYIVNIESPLHHYFANFAFVACQEQIDQKNIDQALD